ncbi:MAG: hypothetical protein JWL76_2040 [Thermoleophilia bacterium]|nr:hypothetical protein [Thermoleophilia bacterium]
MTKKNPISNVVLTRIPPGNTPEVLQFTRIWPLRVAIVVATWRGLTELLVRRRELASTGELDLRVARRRAERIDGALVRAGVSASAREAVRVPVSAFAPTHASVQVGSIHGSDLDDVGLLEAAMRRSSARPPLVTYIDDAASDAATAHATAWGEMLGEENVVERFRRVVVALGTLPLLALVLGVALTFYPLVRPLDDIAPWFAIGGLALVGAGVLGARWARQDEDDEDEDPDAP